MVPHRSTKGASKARRDHINHEIRNLRALLPVSRDDQERLSYLHSMAAVCTFVRKSVHLQGLSSAADRSNVWAPSYESVLPALHGFILVSTAEGKLLYVSENVDEYLGLSMLDVLQGDTLFDMVEQCDVDVVKSNLEFENNSCSERSFICRMQASKSFRLQHGGCCSVLVRGSFRSFPGPCSQPLFVALCTPTVDRLQGSDSGFCLSFSSVHRPDMSFTELSESVSCCLGFSAEELVAQSWYSLVHPEDLSACAASHRSLIHADEGCRVEMVLRLQSRDLSWTWIYTQANKLCETQGVSCTNFIISETEARFLQEKVSGEAFKLASAQLSPRTQGAAKCLKRRRTSDSQGEERSARAKRESDPDVYFVSSPAPSGDGLSLYSPAPSASSSCSALQQEELGRDLLVEAPGYQLMSSPECSFSSPSAVLPDQSFEAAAFVALTPPSSSSSSSSSSPGFEPSDVRLVPDCLSLTDVCDSSMDCALHQDDFTLLQQQGGNTEHVHHVPRPLTFSPLAPPSSACGYSEREQAEISILAQQISSLANSFAASSSLNPLHNVVQPGPAPSWPPHPPPPPPRPLKYDDDLHDCMLESILTDLHAVAVKSPACGQLEEELLDVSLTLAETLVDPFGLQLGRPDNHTELHQLNHYMQRLLQQDALAEENLY